MPRRIACTRYCDDLTFSGVFDAGEVYRKARGMLITLAGSRGALLVDLTCFAFSALLMSRYTEGGHVVLIDEGLVSVSRQGKRVYYSLERDRVRTVPEWQQRVLLE